jgi:hypothetical protein
MGVCASDNTQGNIWDQIEQKNADLVQRYPGIVQGVKLLDRQTKPLAMPSIHPIMCEQEEQPPYEQDTIVDDGTPEQYLAYYRYTHNLSPTHRYLGV